MLLCAPLSHSARSLPRGKRKPRGECQGLHTEGGAAEGGGEGGGRREGEGGGRGEEGGGGA
eukprot:327772-Hanusia_phi.AAC.2